MMRSTKTVGTPTLDAHRYQEAVLWATESGFGVDHDLAVQAAYRLLSREASRLAEAKWVGSYRGGTFDKDVLGAFSASDAFRKTRRKITTKERGALDKRLSSHAGQLTRAIRQFQADEIDVDQLHQRTKAALKKAHFDAYQTGLKASGYEDAMRHSGTFMSPDDQQFVQGAFSQEMRYWNTLLGKLERGETIGATKQRVRAYIDSLSSMFDAARVVSTSPYTIIQWLLEDNNACKDCKELHSNSPYSKHSLPTQPKGGLTRCRNRCRCRLRFVEGTSADILAIESRMKTGTPNLIKKIQRDQKAGRSPRKRRGKL